MAIPSTQDEHIKYLRGAVQYLVSVCAALATPEIVQAADAKMKLDETNPLGPYVHDFGKEGAFAVRGMIVKAMNRTGDD